MNYTQDIKKINYLNRLFSLEGKPVNEALEELRASGVNLDNMDLSVEGDTLFIMARTGSKGAVSVTLSDLMGGNEKNPEDILGKEIKTRRVIYEIDQDGNRVFISPDFTADEIKVLAEKGYIVDEDTTEEEAEQLKEVLANIPTEKLLNAFQKISPDLTMEDINVIRDFLR